MWDVLGSAAWSEDFGHWRYSPIGDSGCALDGHYLLLGESLNPRGFLHVRAPRQHLLSIAPTRSGKGVSLIIPNLLNYRGSVLVVDPKGENAWVTAARRRAMGQKTHIVDPWDEVNGRYGTMAGAPEKAARFNPLSLLDPESDEYVDDVASLADAVIVSEGTKEPHWDNSARELVSGLIAFLVEHPDYKAHASLGLMRDLLSGPPAQIRAIVKAAQELGGLAARKLAPFEGDTDEISSITSNARTQTAFLDSPALKRNLEASDFSFDELCGGDTSVYLVLPPDKLDTYARWLRLMVTVGIRAVARKGSQGRHGLPALFMLDEFGTIGRLNAVAQAYGLMAGLGMILWGFVQDLNQLKRDYPHDWETFIGNSQAVTCFGVMDNFTAEYVSKILGVATVEQKNTSSTVGTSDSGSGGSRSHSTSTSIQAFSRPLMQPDEVRNLPANVGIIMGRFAPILGNRIVYHEDWDLLHWARPDPHFPRSEQVRWRALHRRLFEMRSVARLLKDYDYEVKKRWMRWEVKSKDGKSKHRFANGEALWRWTYVLAIDGAEAAQKLLSASV